MILLPDDWQLPEGLSFTPYDGSTVNHYTQAQWQQMEDAGAVIIPAAGYFNNKLSPKMRHIGEEAYLPSSGLQDEIKQLYLIMKVNTLVFWPGNNTGNLFYAFPRRLVRDTVIPFEPEYVDLGLSVLWATTNVGATTPEEYGDYFAWGETEPKENFAWENYKWCDGTKSSITKYNATDGLTTLLPEDDAAYVNWGREWRMPTNDELTELRTLCTWEAETINGVKGAKVTGPNGNSIFIPLGGSYNTFDDQLNSVGTHGWLYSSTKASSDNQAREIGVSSSGGAQTSCSRCVGLNIRPIRQNKTYYYGFTDEQFAAATSTWNPPGMGWAIIDQSPIQGKVLYGIRMKVAKAGSFNLYKVTTLAETSESNMQFVTTVTTSKTGLQNIDFEAPFYLAANEYLVVSRPSDASTTTLVGNHMTSDNMLQPFYRQVGTPTVSKANVSSLMVDFY